MTAADKPLTKAAAKALQVETNRQEAYMTKVRTLTGHVGLRLARVNILTAYHAGLTADAYAAQVAAREPVGLVVHPMKANAVQHAHDKAVATVERVRADLEAHGWDVEQAAPYPWRGNSWDNAVQAAKDKSTFYSMLVKDDPNAKNRHNIGAPRIVIMSDTGVARYIKQREESAAFQYDAFICKLVSKVGDVKSAALEGNHIWGHSILTVVRFCGTVERWKTQQIVNYSKFGEGFYQWPTRKVKGG